MRNPIAIILCGLLLVSPAVADETTVVGALLKDKINAVVMLLQDKAVDKAHRNERISEIVSPIFDYQTMAKLSLGKKYWPTLSEEQQKTFSALFTERLQESYLDKLGLYSDEQVVYGEPQAEGKTIHTPVTLIARDSRINMLYKFYKSAQGWQIYDVEIGGVSLIQTYRSQFDGVLRDGTIDDLFARLRTDGAFAMPEPGGEGARPGTE